MTLGGEIVRAHVTIAGKVQMVGYRYSTQQQAQRLDINGWVRNLPDGRVEAIFQGKKDKVDQILQWCHHGSAAAVVETVSVEWEPVTEMEGFEIIS